MTREGVLIGKVALFVSRFHLVYNFFSVLTWQLGIRLQNICKKTKKQKEETTNNTNTGWNAIVPAIRCGVTETQNNCRASQPGVQPRTF